jgi:hypothetical protein
MSETAQAKAQATESDSKQSAVTIIGRLTQEPFDMDNGTTIINLANETEGPQYLKMFLDNEKKEEILGKINPSKGDRLEIRGFVNPPKKEKQTHTLFPLSKAKLYVPEKLEFRGTMIKSDEITTIKPKDDQEFDPYEKGKFTVVVENGEDKEFHKVEASGDAIKGIKALPVIEDLKEDPKRNELLDVFVKGEVARRRYDFKKDGKQIQGVATYVKATKVVIGTDNINKYQETKSASKKR